MTREALEKQWKEKEQMEDEASHYGSEENSSDVDSSGEKASSDFEPSSGENDGSDGDHASGENNASMVSTSGDAFDVENEEASSSTLSGSEVLESEIQNFTPNDLQESTPEEIEARQAELMGENISTGDSGGFLDGFPRRWHGWDAFHAAFDRFCEETYQRFPGHSSTSVGARNKQIKNNKKKYTPRGSGERQHTLVRYVGCTARINVRVTWNGSWYLFVEPKGFHNHRCSKALWSYYAENRRITDPAVLGDVAEMRNAGANARGIVGYL
ncbi:hypothetical protein PPTG_02520 [Phytophthora nicotianae INRA-310]|uniref:FAR1 domain-containing protein n=1 Tax=Phytophthora nicotianae (strain INRA-310) TaxID=761204 RepID=W2RBK8_PHYN3|nr:hypothetical protein PPTG_02520 [Phytophthora nicotianae INRA-310]ETN22641.1 hypothetical protein PPTG_02520 [Phytophthora nicotianae INRA-310]